ncbi:MFS transporter [Modestobacter sp. I12A-02628]|uniref:MFS transporter n=1 Tax=Goekera deserti TaxID=2497753 RepID=A0A7K3WF57_9ACTN|nr:MFS transporter [Goekera deserti]MPQ97968.1 MFS transporter [Goekera deserti]NDI48615.1 MFS transporter [Goekera deserti]NEL55006.1 MFS transporter [Goekera deserti]
MRQYLTVWRLPSAPVLLVSGFAGRLPSAMVPLALLLMVQQQTGSYAVAGAASATYGVAMAVVAPVLGRLADRRGPRPVLLVEAVTYPLSLAVLAVTVLAAAPTAGLIAASALAGASTPLVSGTVRALWARTDPRVQPTAFALDATTTELVFVTGPTLVAVITLLADPGWALAVAGGLGVIGTLGLAGSAALRSLVPSVPVQQSLFATVRTPGMPRVLVSGTGLMLGFGAIEVAVPAFADAAGAPGLSGVLLGVWALGSVAGGLWFGARVVSVSASSALPPDPTLPRLYRWGLLGVTLGMAPLAAVSSPWVLAGVLFLGGSAIAPTLTVQSSLVGSIAPAHATTEAFTWLSTVAFGASAVGAAVGGALIESPAGVEGALVMSAVATALAVVVTLLPGRRPVPVAGAARRVEVAAV